jgi:hypothetical protein
MPALVAGIHALLHGTREKGVDGRDNKPGHDAECVDGADNNTGI